MKPTPIIIVFSLCFSLIASAAGVKEKKRWDQATIEVESVKVEAEKTCQVSFEFSFDKETFISGTELSELDNHGMNGYCGDAFAAIGDLCEDTDYREAMENVKSVSCAFDKEIDKPDANFEEGHLRFTFNWNTANHRQTVKEFLEESL